MSLVGSRPSTPSSSLAAYVSGSPSSTKRFAPRRSVRSRPRRASGSGSLPAGPKRDCRCRRSLSAIYGTSWPCTPASTRPSASPRSAVSCHTNPYRPSPRPAPDLHLATLDLARRDEGCDPDQLPLLFRVDREIGIAGGRTYLADCGGRGQCFPVSGAVCLQHLGGAGKPLRSGWGAKLDAHRDDEGPRGFDGGGE